MAPSCLSDPDAHYVTDSMWAAPAVNDSCDSPTIMRAVSEAHWTPPSLILKLRRQYTHLFAIGDAVPRSARALGGPGTFHITPWQRPGQPANGRDQRLYRAIEPASSHPQCRHGRIIGSGSQREGHARVVEITLRGPPLIVLQP